MQKIALIFSYRELRLIFSNKRKEWALIYILYYIVKSTKRRKKPFPVAKYDRSLRHGIQNRETVRAFQCNMIVYLRHEGERCLNGISNGITIVLRSVGDL